tara:strand:- start:21 stop:953 length:933 start_codon:yes stop_codon:yes gene_type:complete
MVFNQLCPPALIYLIFSTTQVIIDSVKGLYNTALIKIWVAILFTILLNYLCSLGLGTISWLIVFIPFILMTLVVAVLLLMFGLDPKTGKLKIEDKEKHKHHKHGPEEDNTHTHGDGPHADHGSGHEKKHHKHHNKHHKKHGHGMGESKLNDVKGETKQEKTDRILTRSVLFYQEEEGPERDGMLGKKKGDEDLKGASEVKDDGTSFDTNNIKLFIEDQTNLLFGMGEHEIASWYKTSALECINSLEGTKKEKQNKVENCLSKLKDEIVSKIPTLDKKNRFENNVLHRYCPDAKTEVDCKDAWIKNWLKFD